MNSAGRRARQRGWIDPGVFQRLPGEFQEQPLLRVDFQRFAWTDPEEAGVEPGNVLQEAPAATVGGAGTPASGSGSYSRSRSQPRLVGSSEIASVAELTSCHSSSGRLTVAG